MDVGILGGTFDPPHKGHLELARIVLASGEVEQVWLVPCYSHRFGKNPASFADRLAMCRLLVADEREMAVSDIERELKNPGFTLELLRALSERFPSHGLRLVAGTDIYHERGKWHRYVTVVYQINRESVRLLWLGEHRQAKTLLRFFRWFNKERTSLLEFICSDMWRPYLKVIAKKAHQATHILDRFHIMMHLNKAIDKVRAAEAKDLAAKGYMPVLKKSRWLLLKRPENLTDKQDVSLATLLQFNLKTVRSYLLKEDFQCFWHYRSAYWAGQFLDRWCTRAMRSRIEPMKHVAKMLRRHRELILNWFRSKKAFSSGIVEGLNGKAKVTTRKAYGYKTFKMLEIAPYHSLGALPEPETTHEFF